MAEEAEAYVHLDVELIGSSHPDENVRVKRPRSDSAISARTIKRGRMGSSKSFLLKSFDCSNVLFL